MIGHPVILAMSCEISTGMRAPIGIAYINALGNIVGFVGPTITGQGLRSGASRRTTSRALRR